MKIYIYIYIFVYVSDTFDHIVDFSIGFNKLCRSHISGKMSFFINVTDYICIYILVFEWLLNKSRYNPVENDHTFTEKISRQNVCKATKLFLCSK